MKKQRLSQSPNKQLQRTVQTASRRGARASFHYARAPRFYSRSSDLPLARDFLSARIARDESVVLVARGDAGDALGFVQLFPSFSSVRAAPIYILNDLFVSPSARRVGVGTLLLNAAVEVARASGAVRLKLSTAITNTPAQRLYECLGWKRDEDFYEYGYRCSLICSRSGP
jgi:GNAT superfamily N-acetyltransferase